MQRRPKAALRTALMFAVFMALTGLHAKRGKNRKPPKPPVGGQMKQNRQDAESDQARPSHHPNGTYVPVRYHGKTNNPVKNKAPENGQAALDNSVPLKPETTSRRVGVDKKTGEIVVFDEQEDGKFHGHVRSWDELSPGMRAVLIKAGMTSSRGKIL